MNVPDIAPVAPSDSEEITANGPELVELVRTVLSHHTSFTFGVTGASMWPFIRDRDVVTASPVQGEVRVGDIVVAIHPQAETLLVHRVIERAGDAFWIKGDASAQPDGLATPARILGRVTRIQRNGRDVRLGLGAEGRWIAALTRRRFLSVLLFGIWRRADRLASCSGRARHHRT